ncbi:centromere R isoform X1 [Pelobates cultripes]|uniref:Centromere R isoform X1 n=1 Tax=Pelobates cultripes TaxID=61616 RepID=A0AAD1SUY3_PELCU|nr:centromere R isoform X1 [Pelobates cultripes]
MSQPVRRSLRLDGTENKKNEASPARTPLQFNLYSPTTGTCKISTPPVANKLNAKGLQQDKRQGEPVQSNRKVPESTSRGQHPTDENADVLDLLSRFEKSADAFLKMRQSLKHLQALEGSRELGHLTGFGNSSNDLKAELQKTKVLISEARKKKQKIC